MRALHFCTFTLRRASIHISLNFPHASIFILLSVGRNWCTLYFCLSHTHKRADILCASSLSFREGFHWERVHSVFITRACSTHEHFHWCLPLMGYYRCCNAERLLASGCETMRLFVFLASLAARWRHSRHTPSIPPHAARFSNARTPRQFVFLADYIAHFAIFISLAWCGTLRYDCVIFAAFHYWQEPTGRSMPVLQISAVFSRGGFFDITVGHKADESFARLFISISLPVCRLFRYAFFIFRSSRTAGHALRYFHAS